MKHSTLSPPPQSAPETGTDGFETDAFDRYIPASLLDGPPASRLRRLPRKNKRADGGLDSLDARLSFVSGTKLITDKGRLAVDKLNVGDKVWTLENGMQPLRNVGRSTTRFGHFNASHRPILLRKDTFRKGSPARDIRVSPRLWLVVDDWQNEADLTENGALMSAGNLIHQDVAGRDLKCVSVTYFYLTFDAPQIVETEGVLSRMNGPIGG